MVIGPGGVWLVDSKAYRGARIKVLGDGRLWYGKWCMDDVLAKARWEAERVGDVLGVDVRPVLCVHGARLPRDPLSWDGTMLASARTLLRTLVAASVPGWSRTEVAELGRRAGAVFPPAERQQVSGP